MPHLVVGETKDYRKKIIKKQKKEIMGKIIIRKKETGS